jgi:tRNA(Ile)-lysidine synthase
MKERVIGTVRRYGLLSPGDRVLVAVSGGADSLCLLHLLHNLSAALEISLHAVYVNHGLRPEAALESQFVRKWASRLGIPFTSCRVDVKSFKKNRGLSGQDAARRLRYGALRRTAAGKGCNVIAAAHHRDDRVETMLLRLLAGSGLDGLAGLPVRRRLAAGLTLVRPLYDCWRIEIESYCRQYGLSPVSDRSNLDPHYLRNRVRLRLVPFLEQEFGPHIRRALADTGDLLAADSRLLSALAEQAYRETVSTENGCLTLDLAAWRKIPEALQTRLLRRMMWEYGVERPSRAHVNAVLGLAGGGLPSAAVSLPSGVTARREYGIIKLTRSDNTAKIPEVVLSLAIPGSTALPGGRRMLTAAVLPASAVSFRTDDRNEAFLDFDTLKPPLVVRLRRPGDRVRLLGAPGNRKLKNIFIDRKIPAAQRQVIPVVESGGQIVWVGGVDIAHDFRVTPETSRVLHLKISET